MFPEVFDHPYFIRDLLLAPSCQGVTGLWEAYENARPPFSKADAVADIERTFAEAEVLSGTLAVQPGIDEGYNFVSGVDEL
jgi:hypothetical protein